MVKSLKQFLLATTMFMAVVTFHISQVSAPKVVKVHELKLEEQVSQHMKMEVAKTNMNKIVAEKI